MNGKRSKGFGKSKQGKRKTLVPREMVPEPAGPLADIDDLPPVSCPPSQRGDGWVSFAHDTQVPPADPGSRRERLDECDDLLSLVAATLLDDTEPSTALASEPETSEGEDKPGDAPNEPSDERQHAEPVGASSVSGGVEQAKDGVKPTPPARKAKAANVWDLVVARAKARRTREAEQHPEHVPKETPEQRAERLSEEGFALLHERDLEAAWEAWSEASRLVPDSRRYRANVKRLAKKLGKDVD